MVKLGAFLPPRDGRTSVFRTISLTPQQVRALSATAQDRVPLAVGTISVKSVLGADLKVEPDNDPFRHANIVGWPDTKFEQKDRALVLAQSAALEVYS